MDFKLGRTNFAILMTHQNIWIIHAILIASGATIIAFKLQQAFAKEKKSLMIIPYQKSIYPSNSNAFAALLTAKARSQTFDFFKQTMTTLRKKIVILKLNHTSFCAHQVDHYAHRWANMGFYISYSFNGDNLTDADIIVMCIDSTIVPTSVIKKLMGYKAKI